MTTRRVFLVCAVVVLCMAVGVAARRAPSYHAARAAPVPLAPVAPVRSASPRKSVPMTFVHVTDVHGWVFGDTHSPKADFGDFASMVTHMKKRYADMGEELFFIDSGDLVDGTGLSDGTPVDGQDIFPMVSHIPYDALTIGNHDLEHNATMDLMMAPGGFIEKWGGNYLTANVYYLKPDSPRFNKTMGEPFRVVTTASGTRILYLGFVYNFDQNGNVSRVQHVEDTVKSAWFADALATPDLDLIVLTAHIDPDSHPELQDIQAAIRAVHPRKPLAMFVGHRHELVFRRYDANTFALESGKYFEHIGLARLELDAASGELAAFDYEWVRTTRDNLERMAGVRGDAFLTDEGRAMKAQMKAMYDRLHLEDVFGCSPREYDPYANLTQPDCMYTFYIEEVVPKVVLKPREHTQYFITNTASLRSKMYAGEVTRNDIYSICPFNDTFAMYTRVKGADVAALVRGINNKKKSQVHRGCHLSGEDLPAFATTAITLDPNGVYDVVAPHYDTHVMDQVWAELGKASEYVVETYPTTINNTGALGIYVEQFMPCHKAEAGTGTVRVV